MEKIVEKKLCTGCNACKSICPKQAIHMEENEDGFLFPVIDEKKCINCGLCKRTCPVINTQDNKSMNKCYVAYAKEREIRYTSSSGGIFTLIANEILKANGIVIGAMLDSNHHLKHIAIEKSTDLEKLKGSKYLQSELNNIFEYIKENIKEKKILFVGTPCQVAGLKAYIKKEEENLICIDLVCHGVPSPKLFIKYIQELEKENGRLISYNFRDNSTGWENYSNSMIFKNKEIKEKNSDNKYMRLFLSNLALRESCYSCNFKLGNKYSDITLGDFWGIKNKYPEIYNKEGVSAIIINTIKGNEIIELIKENMIFKECSIDDIVLGNPSLKESCLLPKKRETFMKDMDELSIDALTKKYIKKTPFYRRVLRKLKRLIHK